MTVLSGIRAGDTQRVLALHRLQVLDAEPDAAIERLTRLAALAVRAPVVRVSFVDQSRQWFGSGNGNGLPGSPRDQSFCGEVVATRCPLVVRDATRDARFASHPLVTGPLQVRAYLGVPLFTRDGHAIGTLCALDPQVREFGARDIDLLGEYAGLVAEMLHTREVRAREALALQQSSAREQRYRMTFERAAVGIAHTAPNGRMILVNQCACDMLGYTEAELTTMTFVDITHPDDVSRNAELFAQLLAGRLDSYHMDKRFLRRDGSFLWGYLSVTLIRDAHGQPDHLVAVIADISERKRLEQEVTASRDALAAEITEQTRILNERNLALRTQVNRMLESERRLRDAEARLRSIADSVPAMIGYWNRDLNCEFANREYQRFFGRDPAEIIGRSMRDLMGDALFEMNEPHARLALEGHPQHFERTLTRSDGTVAATDARYVPDVGPRGDVRGFHVLVTDITAQRKARVELEAVNTQLTIDSTTDYLTGTCNRKVFSERSHQAAQRHQQLGEGYGLVLLDVDDFKRINDVHGHDVGDEVLAALGRILMAQLRGSDDVVARLGGEEFAVLCFGDLTEEALCNLGERLRHQVSQEAIGTPRGPVAVTCSFGVARSNDDDDDWKRVYARADTALYEAKKAGKNCVIFGRAPAFGHTGRFRTPRSAKTR